jgi:hypothetical protein
LVINTETLLHRSQLRGMLQGEDWDL